MTHETETKQIAVRLPVDLLDRLEAHASRMKAGAPGVGVTRADAIRALLLDALDRVEAAAPSRRTK